MTTADAQAFWAGQRPEGWVRHYRESDTATHRPLVIDALREAQPWTSLFEVGCHCGPMLTAIRRHWPAADLNGCDLNHDAVVDARDRFPTVIEGAFPDVTADWPDQCVDIVLDCYTFAYFDPLDIGPALAEAGRLARVGVILLEPMAWDVANWGEMNTERVFSEWRHPYLHILQRLAGFAGWTAHCHEVDCPPTRLSGLIRVMRP